MYVQLMYVHINIRDLKKEIWKRLQQQNGQ